jgi:colanic acid/amylovoran biosynthesis protein
MKIVITGVTGFRNRGVEALVRPTVEQLLKRYPEAEITIATWSPDYDRERLNIPQVSFVEDCYLKCRAWSAPPVIPGTHQRLALSKRIIRKISRTMGWSASGPVLQTASAPTMPFEVPDLVLVSGGDLISSDYGTESLAHFIEPVKWAKSHGVPCAMIGQSIGKFKCEADLELWKTAVSAATLITLREPMSLDYLRNELGNNSSSIIETADCAFLLEIDKAISSQQPCFPDGGPTIAISISESIASYTSSNYGLHLDAWVALIKMMLDEWHANVAIIPHVQERYADDRKPSTIIFRRLGCDSRVRVYGEDLSASEFKGIISRCEMVIAERMHAAIAGFSSGICTVPIGYSIKARGITASVLSSSGLDPDDLSIPLEQLLDAASSKIKLTKIWTQREFFQIAIAKGLKKSIQNASKNFDLIHEICSAKS